TTRSASRADKCSRRSARRGLRAKLNPQKTRGSHDGQTAELARGAGGGGCIAAVVMNHPQFSRPARVSGERNGNRGGRVDVPRPDRALHRAAGAVVLHPLCSEARDPTDPRVDLALHALCDWLLDVALERPVCLTTLVWGRAGGEPFEQEKADVHVLRRRL